MSQLARTELGVFPAPSDPGSDVRQDWHDNKRRSEGHACPGAVGNGTFTPQEDPGTGRDRRGQQRTPAGFGRGCVLQTGEDGFANICGGLRL